MTVCGVHRIGRLLGAERVEEALANGRLIAAAPDLLVVCKIARALVEGLEEGAPSEATRMLLNGMNAAIARAEGRT